MSKSLHQHQSKGQLSGKYYRTRSLSQNLQQIFQPNRPFHSRSINNLSAERPNNLEIKKSSTAHQLNIPSSLPQSPRILIEPADSPFYFSTLSNSKPLNFPSTPQSFPMFNYPIYKPSKVKSYDLGEYRKRSFLRSVSVETPKTFNPFKKRPSLMTEAESNRYQIGEVLRENSELLRKYSEPKIHHDSCSSLSLWQSTFKAKLASLFKNKKKYTIAEPSSSGRETTNDHYNPIPRTYSAQSLPALVNSQKHAQMRAKTKRKTRKKEKQLKVDGKLKTLSLNPPQMIGGSYDNLLLINRLNKQKKSLGTYDTYHGRPLMSHGSRIKALCKYRKPSESDDATTLSYEYDSGDLSDSSSLAQSSSDISSSYSDVTTKSSNRLKMSDSVHSMPSMMLKRDLGKVPNSSPFFMTGFPILSNPSRKFINNAAPAAKALNLNAQSIKNFFTNGPGSSDEFPLVSQIQLLISLSLYFSLLITHK